MPGVDVSMVETYRSRDGRTKVSHLDGVPWNEAPVPPRIHGCRAQTEVWSDIFNPTLRCACGATSTGRSAGVYWTERNSRTEDKPGSGHRAPTRRSWALWALIAWSLVLGAGVGALAGMVANDRGLLVGGSFYAGLLVLIVIGVWLAHRYDDARKAKP